MSVAFYKRKYDPILFFLNKEGINLGEEDVERLKRLKQAWDFYEGFHWENIEDTGQPQVTVNYCKTFINKFVAFEVGKGFVIKMKPKIESIDNDNDPLDLLNDVWDYNKKDEKLIEFGQSKAVTGDVWVQAYYIPKTINGKDNPNFQDPFEEYPNGQVKLIIPPSSICFPEYDDYNKDFLKKMTIMFLKNEKSDRAGDFNRKIYRIIYTKDKISEYIGDTLQKSIPNKYGFIPFIHIKNYPLHGRIYGMSDIDDIIPINSELNLKKSNISEIIDYHSAPITIVFGARIAQLQRGANKVWGGLPKDARVENLELEGELGASQKYIEDLKKEMMEVAGIPIGSLGGELNISNTSGVALHISLMPLLEKIQVKQKLDAIGLSQLNKMILKIAVTEKMIKIPEGVKPKDFYYNEIIFDSMLPKDILAELQQLDMERKMMLITREQALKRLGRDNVEQRLKDIEEELIKIPEFYGINNEELNENKEGDSKQINSGFTNSNNPKPNILK